MRFLLAALLSTAALAAEDAREIVLRSVNHDTQQGAEKALGKPGGLPHEAPKSLMGCVG